MDITDLSMDGTVALSEMLELYCTKGLTIGDQIFASPPTFESGNEEIVTVLLTANPNARPARFTGSKKCRYHRLNVKKAVKGRRLGVFEIPKTKEIQIQDTTLSIGVDPYVWLFKELKLLESEFDVVQVHHPLAKFGICRVRITAKKDSYVYYGSITASYRQKKDSR